MAASKFSWPFYGVEKAEIDGVLWAVQTPISSGWNNCFFEGDARSVIDALNGKVARAVHNQVLIDNILTFASRIEHASFAFCFREANMVAHRLARWSATSFCDMVWCEGGPTKISYLIVVDSS
ncbi:unnamed protein product [Amaranthus hypochondriacus]